MAAVSRAALELPQRSVMPPGCMATFRGWLSSSKFDFAVPLSVTVRMPSDISVKEFAAKVTLPVPIEPYNMILVELYAAMSSDIVMLSLPETIPYDVEDIVGDVVSSWDIAADRWTSLELPQRSVMPPGCMAMFRGWFRASKFDFVVPFRVVVRRPSNISVNAFAANVTLPDFVESYSIIFVELYAAMSSNSVTSRLPEIVPYIMEDIEGDMVSSSDMADVRCAVFELPQMSVMPPGCIVMFRGWFRDSNFAFAVLFSDMLRMPSDISVKEFAANVTLPDFVESYSIIFVES